MSSLQEIAEDRKLKLQALRAKRTASERDQEDANHKASSKALKFRNYNPHTEQLKENKLNRTLPESIENQVTEQIEAANQAHVEEVNLANLAPKKIDWDLKRDIAKKIDKLERETQKAIVELIRERIQSDSTALASAVAGVDSLQQ